MLMLLYLVKILVLSDLVDKKWVFLSNLRTSFGLHLFNIIFAAISDVVLLKKYRTVCSNWDKKIGFVLVGLWLVWMLVGKFSPKFYLLVWCRKTLISTEAGKIYLA